MRTINKGFTLIQVIVALAIVTILAGIAYPSYQESVRKGKRTEGRAALYELLQQEERFYSRHNSYIGFSSASTDEEEKNFKWYSGDSPKTSAYEIKAAPCKDDAIQNCVVLSAMPGTEKVDSRYRDPFCGVLTLSSAGEKTADSPECWR
ncbi:type IV pilin protein [Herbaspirillum sp. HC18]|nr:type IV pilin protein [Herbaspirillum sp. HC18]